MPDGELRTIVEMPRWIRVTIGLLGLVGGFLALWPFALIMGMGSQVGGLLLMASVFAIFCVIGAWGGVLLLRADPRAIKLNRVFWAVQIPVAATAHLSYTVASGCLLSLWLRWPPSAGFNFYLGSMFKLRASLEDSPEPQRFIGINLIALVIFLVLRNYRGGSAVPAARVVERAEQDASDPVAIRVTGAWTPFLKP